MKTYVQRTARTAPFSSLGLDPSFTAGTAVTADTPFSVTNWVNTPGGIIRGYELNLNQAFSFLPGALSNTGVAVNYTHVASKMKYYLTTTTTTPTEYDLLNMSPKSANLTVYYDDKKLSARVTTAYRSKYTYQLLPGSNSDFQGKNHTTNIDAQISYNITENLTATFQAVNLTDQYDDRFNAYNTAFGNVDSNVPSEAMHTGRSYLVGLRYKY
jgi:outer membrane receptor protein involved in Fe transport